jgi:hypothetical protein
MKQANVVSKRVFGAVDHVCVVQLKMARRTGSCFFSSKRVSPFWSSPSHVILCFSAILMIWSHASGFIWISFARVLKLFLKCSSLTLSFPPKFKPVPRPCFSSRNQDILLGDVFTKSGADFFGPRSVCFKTPLGVPPQVKDW